MSVNPGRILVVDDNQLNRMLLTRALAEQGHTSATAENGRQALDLLRAEQADESTSFDVVLLDIEMPEMDGFEVLQHLRSDAALRNIPVIVISALDEFDRAVRCIEMGAEDYLPKPFNPILLRARIDASLEKKRLRDAEHLYLKGLERELEIGREIQFGFLPDELPQPPGWEIAARFQPALQVSGDLYDAFVLGSDRKIGLVVGDVCDKGVGAALYMALFRSLIRATSNLDYFADKEIFKSRAANRKTQSDDASNLRNAITLTNNYIARTHEHSNMFATLFFGILDATSGELRYVNAGHEPPIISGGGRIKASLARTGIAAGIESDRRYGIGRASLAPGDALLLFTDGVSDAINSRGETFSSERLLSLLARPARSAVGLLDRIEASLREHIGDTNQSDDITMLAVRRVPAPKTKPKRRHAGTRKRRKQ